MKLLERLFEKIIGKEFAQVEIFNTTSNVFDMHYNRLEDGDKVRMSGREGEEFVVKLDDEYFPMLINKWGERVLVEIEICYKFNVCKSK